MLLVFLFKSFPRTHGSLPMCAWLSPVGLQALTVGATDPSHCCAPPPPRTGGGRRGRSRGGRGPVQCQPAPPPGEFPARPAPCARGGNNPMPTQRPSGSTGRRECLVREQGRAVAPAFLCETGDVRWLSWGRWLRPVCCFTLSEWDVERIHGLPALGEGRQHSLSQREFARTGAPVIALGHLAVGAPTP